MSNRPSRIHWDSSTIQPLASSAVPSQPAANAAAARATPLLDGLGRDLTRLAREGRLPPMFGRVAELRQLQRILLRKNKNNPLLVGAPGVGKTALVEGLAVAIANGTVAPELSQLRLVEFSSASLTSGTGVRGTFEGRLQQLVAETAADAELLIFIDEIHTLIRAGAVEGGSLDAANILKPALARGEFRCIGATTPDEFERFIRSDPAFERRFDPLQLAEPSQVEAIEILSQARPEYEAHHRVQIQPEAIQAAVRLSSQHVPDRRLPDKAFDLLDNACTFARVPDTVSTAPDILPIVTSDTVAAALAQELGVPIEKLSDDLRTKLDGLETYLNQRGIGQPWAVARITGALRQAFVGLSSARRPMHVFAFFGASGVGKTAMAQALAECLFDSPDAILRLDMSEYKEPYPLSRLWGSPPGYIGYQDEGTFASRLRRQPFAVVLLDEFEKAHREVHDAFLQIFDNGQFTDARGRLVTARHAIFILTSNLFSVPDLRSADDHELQAETVRQRLTAFMRPELINRIEDIVLFRQLSSQDLVAVARLEGDRLNQQLAINGISILIDDAALTWIADQALDPDSGARSVQRLISRQIAEPLSALLAGRQTTPGQRLEVVLGQAGLLIKTLDA